MAGDCKYCGAYISDCVDSCPACGKKVKPDTGAAYAYAKSEAAKARAQSGENRAYTYKDEYQRRYNQSARNAGSVKSYTGPRQAEKENPSFDDYDDVRRHKSISYLCYMGPLFLVPYLTCKDSPFVRFHSNQGLLLLLASVAVNIAEVVPFIGWAIELIGAFYVVINFFKGLGNVSKGTMEKLPVIGDINLLK